MDTSALINQTEYVKTVGNISDLNKVYLGFHEGLQYSVLGPAHIPDDLDFQATSYGSHTECRIVTTQCGAKSNDGNVESSQAPAYNFACNNTMAGLNMTGNFLELGQGIESYLAGFNNVSTEMAVENVNTMLPNDYGFGFQYFNDSAKQEQVSLAGLVNWGLGDVEYGPITNITNQYFWALAFDLDIQLDGATTTQNSIPWAGLDVLVDNQGNAEGIMSCETNISEIVRLAHPPFTALFPCLLSPYTCLIPFPPIHTNIVISPFRPITCPNLPLPSSPPPHPAQTPPSPSSTASPALLATNNSIKA